MVVDSELEEAKAAVLQLMSEKDQIEADIQAARLVLQNVRKKNNKFQFMSK